MADALPFGSLLFSFIPAIFMMLSMILLFSALIFSVSKRKYSDMAILLSGIFMIIALLPNISFGMFLLFLIFPLFLVFVGSHGLWKQKYKINIYTPIEICLYSVFFTSIFGMIIVFFNRLKLKEYEKIKKDALIIFGLLAAGAILFNVPLDLRSKIIYGLIFYNLISPLTLFFYTRKEFPKKIQLARIAEGTNVL